MTDDGQRPRLLQDPGVAVDLLAKAGAAIGIVGLGTGLLFDVIKFREIDQRLLSSFVIADHIETAIDSFPLVLLVIALSGMFGIVLNIVPFSRKSLLRIQARPLKHKATYLGAVAVTSLLISIVALWIDRRSYVVGPHLLLIVLGVQAGLLLLVFAPWPSAPIYAAVIFG